MSSYDRLLLENIERELRVSNWLAAEHQVNQTIDPRSSHRALVQARIDGAYAAVHEMVGMSER